MNKKSVILIFSFAVFGLVVVAIRLAAPPATLGGRWVDDVIETKSSSDGLYRADVVLCSGGATVGSSTFVDLIRNYGASSINGKSRIASFSGRARVNLAWSGDRILMVEYRGAAPTKSAQHVEDVVIILKQAE